MKKSLIKVFNFSKSSQTAITLLTQICIGIASVIGSLFIFLKLADQVLDKEFIFFDNTIINLIYPLRDPMLTAIMQAVTFFGSQYFLGSATLITILILFRKHKKDAFIFSFILFFGIILNILLKDMFQRPRPLLAPLIHESSYSFPSGHAMNSFVFYMSLVYFIFRSTRNKKLSIFIACISGLLVLSIGISRIYLGVHYPSDVIAGYAAGFLWFVLVLLFEKTLQFLRLFKDYKPKKN